MSATVIADSAPVWVGWLDLADDQPVSGVSGPVTDHHRQARILILMHRAPVGHVLVPAWPQETLTARARDAAAESLAGPLHQHAQWDLPSPAGGEPGGGSIPLPGCPRRFPAWTGAGITVVVCTRDRPGQLDRCLAALLRSSYEPLEILIVDNAPSTDITRQSVSAVARRDPRVRYACEPRPGLSVARNHGLALARFDLVAFTDDDTVPDPGWPAALAAGFASGPKTVCVTGPVIPHSLDTSYQLYFEARYSWGDVFEPRRYDLAGHRHPSRLYPFNAGVFGSGANFAVRREAVAQIGCFDPLLGVGGPGQGGEDLDMFLRLILGGGQIVYVPSAYVWHQHRSDVRALGDQLYFYGHGLGAYLAKHLANPALRTALRTHGLRQAGSVVRQMRRASDISHLGTTGNRMALAEARGFIAGAFRYRQALRRAATSPAPSAMSVPGGEQ